MSIWIKVCALDSTTIDLCLSLFPGAKFRQRKAAVKMHALLDLHGNIPTFIRGAADSAFAGGGSFPADLGAELGEPDLRQLLWHRHRMVQARTPILNQSQAVALNEGLHCKKH